MPIYDIECTDCKSTAEVWCDYEDLERERCLSCDGPMKQVITGFSRHGSWSSQYAGYYDRGLGCYIESYHHREKVMKEKGVRPVEGRELELGIDQTVSDFKAHDEQMKKLGA